MSQRCWLSTFVLLVLAGSVNSEEPRVDFARQIQPLLRRRCYSCHSAEKQEGGLRLDRKNRALLGGDMGKAIVPGAPQKSRLFALVTEAVAGERMPPEGSKLTKGEVELLRKWIQQGASWPADGDVETTQHWAFQPLQRPVVPQVKDHKWTRNPVDNFILNRLESLHKKPSGDASRDVLIRRVYLDVTGLPPSPEEWKRWRSDQSADWYERMVDQVLASPHFGERWGRIWLDLARYADSDGYEKDRPRPHAYHWRDWVLDALNRDLAFDQFTVQQLAGDLLPGATPATQLATGFHRNTLTNREGGIDKEEDRVKQTVDRINTISTVWLGLTVKCAQCHSHKYDPITQREYYQLYSFFNNSDEKDFHLEATEEQLRTHQRAKKTYDAQLQKLNADYASARKDITDNLPTILAEYQSKYGNEGLQPAKNELLLHADLNGKLTTGTGADSAAWSGSSMAKFVDGKRGKAVHFQGKQRITFADFPRFRSDKPFTIAAWVFNEGGVGAIATKMDESADFKGMDFTSNEGMLEVHLVEKWPRDAIKVTTKARLKKNQWQHVAVSYDGSRKAKGVQIYIDGKLQPLDTHYDQLKGSIDIAEPLRIGSRKTTTYFRGRIDEVYVYSRLLNEEERRALMGDADLSKFLQIAEKVKQQRTPEQSAFLVDFVAGRRDNVVKLKNQLDSLKKTPPKLQRYTGMGLAAAGKPRRTFVHIRGDFLSKGAEVKTKFPDFLPQANVRGAVPDRLDLARWIVDEKNPLTSRVIVNRIWQHYFQTGLVRTSDDFGSQGELPSHPRLLDWLADELMKRDWRMKSIHRSLLMSSTYRQSSSARPDMLTVDPNNRLLARQNRARVEAELVRDLGLSVAGLLDPRIGGPSVYPPLPPGILELAFVDVINRGPWKTSEGGDRYRRGFYTFFQRTSPHPMLSLFDAPDSNTSCTRRERSNTPLQALTLWNDPMQMETARHFARRILRQEADDDEARIQAAFVMALSRLPSGEDVGDLQDLLQDARQAYRQQPKLAQQLIENSKPDDQHTDWEFAAWVSLARTIMNLDEFITRE